MNYPSSVIYQEHYSFKFSQCWEHICACLAQYLLSIEYSHEAFFVLFVALRNLPDLSLYTAFEDVVAAGCRG